MVEVFTYGNGVMLGNLFQAVAAMTATPDYLALIKITFIISTLVVAIEIIWTGRFRATGRLLTIILMMNAAILSTTDVQIVDRVNSANDSLVASVPAGLAAPLALTTAIGNWATQAFETIFSMPNDLRYQTNGLLFASRLVHASRDFDITQSRMANNLSEFSEGCIYYGMLAGWFTLETVLESGDIWASLPNTSFGNAIFVNYIDTTGASALTGCRDARDLIEADWATAIDEASSVFGMRTFPEYSEADAKARLIATLPQSYNYMAGISQSAADIVRQSAMVNTLRRSFMNVANNSGASGAAQDFALAQAEAQQRTTYSTLGALAGRMMSLFANVLETLIYGIFPLAFVFTLIALMQGKAILMYFKLLLWLQLWPPMFAVLNFAMSVYAAEGTLAAASQAGGGSAVYSMMTYTGIAAVNSDMSAMAGYLSWMIPMFSWALVSGSGFAASQLAASLGSVAQSSGSKAAGDVSTGNLSLGNYGAYNGRMFQENSSPSLSSGVGTVVNAGTGATMTTTSGGMQFMKTPQNSAPFSANLASQIKSSTSTSATSSLQAASNAMSSFMTQTQSTFSNMQKMAQGSTHSAGTTDSSSTGQSAQSSQAFMAVDRLADDFAKKTGSSKGQAAALLLAASMNTKNSLGGKVASLALGVSGSGTMNYQGSSSSNEAFESAQKFAKDNQFAGKWNSAVEAGQRMTSQQGSGTSDSASHDLQAGFTRQGTAQSNLQSSLTEAQAWQSLSARMQEAGSSGSVSAVGDLIKWGNSQLAGGKFGGGSMEQLAAASESITSNGSQATQTLQNVVAAYIQSQAQTMAGVGEAPSSGTVMQANTENQSSVESASNNPSIPSGSGNVLGDARSQMAAVRDRASNEGIPTGGQVNAEVAAVEANAASTLGDVSSQVAQGDASISSQGGKLQSETVSNTEAGSHNHVLNATAQVGNAVADTFSDGAEGLERIFDSVTGQSDNTTQAAEPDAQSGRGKAWANRLD